ncbi:MAG TPA: NrfD/PsrC family molybdoenzyme membrane anchor subunit [Thermoanaerobaculia bacterium]|nr:NrfD/PsrC family molybdoenzyme membrane anchor subunit [Thermoanaerobaculia bacterium]
MKEPRVPDAATEKRLDELRAEAAAHGKVEGKGIHPPGAPMPAPVASPENGYYGLPLLKAPVWTWEIPTYFFVGGAAGASAVIALAAQITGADEKLVRDARWIACIGANLSAPLLIADLGRPERFLNMMRIFKPQSPMSVGAWIVALFGASSTTAVVFRKRVRPLGNAAAVVAALAGLGMATYTGVLLGATAIPAWSKHVKTLPIHFGASGLASACSVLQLRGHDEPALNALAFFAAAFETYTGMQIEGDPTVASEPLRTGATGITTRIGGLFSGPIPLVLRIAGAKSKRFRQAAAFSSLLGSLLTRVAWVEAGKASARDPRVPLGLDESR